VGKKTNLEVGWEEERKINNIERAIIHLLQERGLYNRQLVPPAVKLSMPNYNNILSRVYGSVTNNNGFWSGCLDLLTLLNHIQLPKLNNQSSAEPFVAVQHALQCCANLMVAHVVARHLLSPLLHLWMLIITYPCCHLPISSRFYLYLPTAARRSTGRLIWEGRE
jgi:hypothetical protein